jgi:hypothetical protein
VGIFDCDAHSLLPPTCHHYCRTGARSRAITRATTWAPSNNLPERVVRCFIEATLEYRGPAGNWTPLKIDRAEHKKPEVHLWVVRCFIEATLEHGQAPGAYVPACALLPTASPLFQRKYSTTRRNRNPVNRNHLRICLSSSPEK